MESEGVILRVILDVEGGTSHGVIDQLLVIVARKSIARVVRVLLSIPNRRLLCGVMESVLLILLVLARFLRFRPIVLLGFPLFIARYLGLHINLRRVN